MCSTQQQEFISIIDFIFSLESNAVDDGLPWDATLTLGSVSISVKVFLMEFSLFLIFSLLKFHLHVHVCQCANQIACF